MTTERASEPASAAVPARLSMVVLGARDLPRLRRFYRGLGWPERPGASDELAMFELGSTVLTLHPASAEEGAIGREEGVPSTTLVINVDARQAVDDAVAAAVDGGARPVSAAADQPWGGRSAVVADPEGNRWELLWVPSVGRAGSR